MQKRLVFAILIIASLLFTACAAASPSFDAYYGEGEKGFAPGAPAEEPQAIYADSEVYEQEFSSRDSALGGPESTTAVERLVIFNANLSLVVVDPAASVDAIADLAENMGGFVVSSNTYKSIFGEQMIETTYGSITVRVPAARLDEALEQLRGMAVEVTNENVFGQDVTQEYTDNQSRLTNLEAAESQLREILASAVKTEDVLAVFASLRQVREEIEVIKGRMQYLSESARLSSISIDLTPDIANQPLQIGRWQPQGTAKAAVEALISTLQFLADAGIWALICVTPVALLFGIPGYFAVRSILRRRKAARAAGGEEA